MKAPKKAIIALKSGTKMDMPTEMQARTTRSIPIAKFRKRTFRAAASHEVSLTVSLVTRPWSSGAEADESMPRSISSVMFRGRAANAYFDLTPCD